MFPYFMTAKEHYERHLGSFYSWMAGDFTEKQQEQERFFLSNHIQAHLSRQAVDLGCGHGLQSVSLAHLGFSVQAIDFNRQLLRELRGRIGTELIECIESNLLEYLYTLKTKIELIVCMGDTLTHLSDISQVEELVSLSSQKLEPGGKLILSYRDFDKELINENRFIHVRSDENRIHTCYLEYLPGYIKVFDILNEKENEKWQQRVSWYPKLRLPVTAVHSLLEKHNLTLLKHEVIGGMTYVIAAK
jgi:SAM-dependent methyltransferase